MSEPLEMAVIDTETGWEDTDDTFTPTSPYAVVGWAFLTAAPVVIFAWVKGWF